MGGYQPARRLLRLRGPAPDSGREVRPESLSDSQQGNNDVVVKAASPAHAPAVQNLSNVGCGSQRLASFARSGGFAGRPAGLAASS